ncbi:Uncharacterized protein DBV15_03169 [Temnothorax longispinosus]|uniref:Uncharacterized protein n=1 Tax=Temnothorax longispinosus TaxID=300112 RepID=A0A4V3SB22_9HYME|nr:Uncharacterized protein DBV15_03169 [Temnothorax longispinosus]
MFKSRRLNTYNSLKIICKYETPYDKSGGSRFRHAKPASGGDSGGPKCDLVEQFISHYLRQCGYLGAKGRVHSLKCATSLPRERRRGGGGGRGCERRCAGSPLVREEANRGWHRWTTHIRCTHLRRSSSST